MNSIMLSSISVIIGISLGMMPYISAPNILFGVTLTKEVMEKKEVKLSKQRFFMANGMISILIAIITFFIMNRQGVTSNYQGIWFSLLLMFQMLIGGSLYIKNHFYLNRLKQTEQLTKKTVTSKKMIDLQFRKEKLILPTSFLVMIQLIIIVLTVVVTFLNYDKIPSEIVMQWGLDNEPSRIVPKALGSVYSLPMIQFFLMVVLSVSNQSFVKGKQRVGSSLSASKNKQFRKGSSIMLFVIGLLTQLLLFTTQLVSVLEWMPIETFNKLVIVYLIVILGYVFIFSYVYGQSGSRLIKGAEKEEPIYFDDDQYWKLGAIYFNSEDPSFWVEKRNGLGMTFNFAKWQSWLFMAGVIIVPLLIVWLTV